MAVSDDIEDAVPARGVPEAFAFGALETLSHPVVAFDTRGKIVLANAIARRDYGLWPGRVGDSGSEPEIRFETLDGGAVESGRLPWNRVIDGQGQQQESLSLVLPGEERRAIAVTADPIRGARGEILGAAVTLARVGVDLANEEQLRNFASDIEMLSEVSRMLAEVQDPDEAEGIICMVAIGATGATAVVLWELVEGKLVMYRHESALALDEVGGLVERIRAGAIGAVEDGSTVVAPPDRSAAADGSCTGADGAAANVAIGTAWHEPLTRGGRVTGVLSILWNNELEDLDRFRRLISPLAHHSATALERADLLRRLSALARSDALTGLANRRVWQEALDRELGRAERDRRPLSLVLIDIDHFKSYNDTFGHPRGDRLLRDASEAWAEIVRPLDLVARVGGEEFAVLLPGCELDNALSVADRLRRATPDKQTCSLGVVTWNRAASADQLYEAADAALYRAKRDGRDRVEAGRLD